MAILELPGHGKFQRLKRKIQNMIDETVNAD